MTPKQAKDILAVMQELTDPAKVRPYVEAMITSGFIKDTDPSWVAQYRQDWPAFIASAIQKALAAKDKMDHVVLFQPWEAYPLIEACRKKGIPINKLAVAIEKIPARYYKSEEFYSDSPQFWEHRTPQFAAPIEKLDEVGFFIDTNALEVVAARYRDGGRNLGANETPQSTALILRPKE